MDIPLAEVTNTVQLMSNLHFLQKENLTAMLQPMSIKNHSVQNFPI